MPKRFLQTGFWSSFKSCHGWKSYFFSIDEKDEKKEVKLLSSPEKSESESEETLSVLVRNFKKVFSLAYIPMAPEVKLLPDSTTEENVTSLKKRLLFISEKLFPFLPRNTICIRYDVALDFEKKEERDDFVEKIRHSSSLFTKKRVKKSLSDIQPPDTVLLSLEQSEENLLSNMKSKWRYNIRLSEKKGVKVKTFDSESDGFNEAFESFFHLFTLTSQRDGVQFHKKEYYLDLLSRGKKESENKGENIKVRLYLAFHEEEALAGIIVLFSKREAVYLYGASGNTKRNLMPSYLLQWKAICDAKKEGCPVYDFYGCPPDENEKHPMHGLFLFKTGFGGHIVHRPGSIDIVSKSPLLFLFYEVFKIAERVRSFWFKVLKKKLLRR